MLHSFHTVANSFDLTVNSQATPGTFPADTTIQVGGNLLYTVKHFT